MSNPKYSPYATADIGGSNVRFALFDDNANIVLKYRQATDSNSSEKTCDWILGLINKYQIQYLALCVPGPSDYENGIIHKSPNLTGSWVNFDLKTYFLERSNLKDIVFENDANAMALANHKFYNCDKNQISQFFTISTGFGAGLILEDQIYHGNKYFAQEIAQIPVSFTPCYNYPKLKNPNALELHCSGSGIAWKAQNLKIAENAQEVFKLGKNNNIHALKLIDEAQIALRNMFAISAALLAPNNFFVGGSLALNNKDFVIKAFELAKEISDINHFQGVNLYFDQLGDDSALIGLYYLIKQRNN
ncbi:glucokinase [Mycoplasmopsis mustelae]|uniref:Glucokinase n=1 Tax=Mycoplasmopsis mustelae TaxID=171289 RepID=A0A4R7UEZ1_9BACT|nr:ROK family protein [Mycoplasmopsis mustelae]TDV24463.1 glucokinase [Mycoplasmopsis mustelae]